MVEKKPKGVGLAHIKSGSDEVVREILSQKIYKKPCIVIYIQAKQKSIPIYISINKRSSSRY